MYGRALRAAFSSRKRCGRSMPDAKAARAWSSAREERSSEIVASDSSDRSASEESCPQWRARAADDQSPRADGEYVQLSPLSCSESAESEPVRSSPAALDTACIASKRAHAEREDLAMASRGRTLRGGKHDGKHERQPLQP